MLLAMTLSREIMNWNGTVSLLIACIEFLLLFNLLIFAEKNRLNKIAITMIALLAAYQTMEFLMCQVELQSSFFPYFAFVIISFLPPLNLILTLTLTRNLTLKMLVFNFHSCNSLFNLLHFYNSRICSNKLHSSLRNLQLSAW